MSLQVVGGGPVSLDVGIPLTLANAIATAQTTGALPGSTVGTSSNPTFSVPARGDSGDRTISLNARGIGGTLTTVTASLYGSTDGGVSWQLYQATIPLVATGTATDSQVLHVVAGVLYILLVTALTLNSATAVSVDGALS